MKVAQNDGALNADAAGGRTGQGRGTGTLPATGGQTTGTGGSNPSGTGGQGTGGTTVTKATGGSVGQGGAAGIVVTGSGGMGGKASVVGGGQAGGGKGGAATGGSAGAATGGGTASATGGHAGSASGGSTGVATGGTGGHGTGGVAGATAGTGGRGGAGGTTCPVSSQVKSSRTARSAGFTGTYQSNYYPLYSTACSKVADCASACVAAGGTPASCAASECIDSTPDYCLPPTYWFDLDHLRIEGNTIEDSAWITMVNNPYRDQLIATDFQFEIPTTATIQGIVMSINRSADSTSMIADYEVKLVRDGSTVGLDRGGTAPWPMTFEYASYGDPNDCWGTTFSPADVNAAGFGVALTPTYLSSGGNARGYVDFIRATVYYCP